jgi:hypothetical protein
MAFCVVARQRGANKNSANNGKIPGSPAKNPGDFPGALARVRASFTHANGMKSFSRPHKAEPRMKSPDGKN